ncbi:MULTISPECIES: protein translocase subunit SecF [unclassified Nocardioides]|uniref:protein translocase subunit SecF n=1 Tax=unclassified Nocardioides TaxID=2615069 RepID=UPI0006F7A698|nr:MULTISPECIES: protein translocase subunit SecF [unclassified Nocardioides]KRA32662.1 preprotein translocase subunit SecF [Nocardioides sp. Root614]KRA89315.1 preprotein translocase subunit SecF [Nocardioides sp. Root682]
MGKMSRLGNDLYQGRKSFNFVAKPWLWYAVSLVLVGLAVAVLFLKPLNMGVEFTGGTTVTVDVGAGNANQDAADDLREAVADSGIKNAENPTVTTEGNKRLTVQVENLSESQRSDISDVIQKSYPNLDRETDLSVQDIGPSWGEQVAKRAALGVVIFLILVVLFIWAYFREWRMSVAAFIALVHDVLLTVGVYALSGFQVTPAAVTGVLAILGFSLYDTVVVFDKIKENTHQLRKKTQSYSDAANLAVNQTLVRSINTSIVALIPIGAILYVSAVQLGASSLQDLALAQFVGMAIGVYSSVMLAPRVLVHLKMQETEVQLQARRAKAKQRALADKYATVPVFKDDTAVVAGRAVSDVEGVEEPDELREDDEPGPAETARGARPQTQGAVGKGRVVPASTRPVNESGGAGRKQPVRQPRSKRGKK